MLINDNKLYEQLKNTIQNVYFDIHAIYEPEGGKVFEDCYCAAVDFYKPGSTYRVYFKLDDTGNIEIEHLGTWFFG